MRRLYAGLIALALYPATAGAVSRGIETWDHNGSLMSVLENPRSHNVVISYIAPKPSLKSLGIASATVLFRGRRIGTRISGTAQTFKYGCRPQGYAVTGAFSADNSRIELRGAAPVRETGPGCKVVGFRDAQDANSLLAFTKSTALALNGSANQQRPAAVPTGPISSEDASSSNAPEPIQQANAGTDIQIPPVTSSERPSSADDGGGQTRPVDAGPNNAPTPQNNSSGRLWPPDAAANDPEPSRAEAAPTAPQAGTRPAPSPNAKSRPAASIMALPASNLARLRALALVLSGLALLGVIGWLFAGSRRRGWLVRRADEATVPHTDPLPAIRTNPTLSDEAWEKLGSMLRDDHGGELRAERPRTLPLGDDPPPSEPSSSSEEPMIPAAPDEHPHAAVLEEAISVARGLQQPTPPQPSPTLPALQQAE